MIKKSYGLIVGDKEKIGRKASDKQLFIYPTYELARLQNKHNREIRGLVITDEDPFANLRKDYDCLLSSMQKNNVKEALMTILKSLNKDLKNWDDKQGEKCEK